MNYSFDDFSSKMSYQINRFSFFIELILSESLKIGPMTGGIR